MTKVTYEVRNSAENYKVDTYAEAKALAKKIGGEYKAVYTQIAKAPLSEKDIKLREKRMARIRTA